MLISSRLFCACYQIAVRYQFEWLDELFIELATLSFFILTGYKFRPASNNPYLLLSQSDDEELGEALVTLSYDVLRSIYCQFI